MNKTALAKPAISVLVGASLALAASAGASQTSGNWFTSLFSTGGSGSASSGVSVSMAAVDAAMNQKLQDDAKNCDDVGIGASIKTAMNVHTELASATPNVESLFDINSNCFSSIGQLFDLSFAIPSLSSILAAAEQAVIQYAKKKVCTAVNQVAGMVTSPINQSINKVSQTTGYSSINGMANGAVGNAMSSIDPQLGSSYKPASAATTYSVNSNAFGAAQTVFNTVVGNQQVAQTAPATSAQPQASQQAQPTQAEPQSFTSWASTLFN